MSGLENLQTRLQYKGGEKQLDRMKHSKVNTLKRALLYSYQSQTAILNDGREFRCLINKDKTKIYSDDKVISIPSKATQAIYRIREALKKKLESEGYII